MASKIQIVSKSKNGALGDGLPTAHVISRTNPLALYWLAIAAAGFGKSEFFSCFPESILLACEEGYKMLPKNRKALIVVIDCFDYKSGKQQQSWKDDEGYLHMSFMQAVELLEESNRFKFVIVDTIDSLVKMVTDFTTGVKKVEHVSDIGQYGKGFDLGQNSPFRKSLNRLAKTGRGLGLITHQDINEKSFSKGPKAKKETTLPGGIVKLIIPMVSIVLHGEFGKRRKPNRFRDRICVTEGSEDLVAKNRGGILPSHFIVPLDQDDKWKMVEGFFSNPKTIAQAETAYEKIYDE
jgi:hypothetical protein